MKLIFCDHWREAPEGWTVLKQEDQDITKPFPWADNSVEFAFSCHGVEHCDFMGGIAYFKEVYRVLQPGGVVRTVAPFIDRLLDFEQSSIKSIDYARTSLMSYYPAEVAAIKELKFDFEIHGLPFLFDSLIKGHGHRFVWSTSLMKAVLLSIGFRDVEVMLPWKSAFSDELIQNRLIRGLSHEFVAEHGITTFDCESYAIEARK